ncbi:interleukin-12 subunit alpha, partial [Austrofundulus limnaeus]|uniref:Interleukin-12 subunit alpha n=1 Tax=Austrofundulus limnaeus TaxID=52670 RepID=A0A2I4BFD0_AUSLI
FVSPDFASCVLQLLLLSLSCRTSGALPLPDASANRAQCAKLFKTLLKDITGLFETQDLCDNQITSTIPSMETVQACAPTQGLTFLSSSPQSECLRSIMKDLAYYEAAIQSYLQTPLHREKKEKNLLLPFVTFVQNLRKDCSTTASAESDSTEVEAAVLWIGDSYTNRQKMCKMMRGFHVRAITINRAMGYISSGDHRK